MSQVIRTRVVESGGAVETSTERVRIIEGISPTVDLQRVEDGVEITVHDVRGEQSAEVMDGAPGFSPTITVTDITGGHRVTITDETGPHSFDVMDGTGSVQDVQVAGVSVVQDGVANVPIASASQFGAVKIGQGVKVQNNSLIYTDPAWDSIIKSANGYYQPIVPSNQHKSAFYGLAKAAGSDEKDSTLPVGQYTDAAKSAISEMLNGSVSVSGTTPIITGKPGIRYVCGECATLAITVPATGIVDVTFTSGSTPTVLTVTPPSGVAAVKWANGFDPSSLDANTVYEINVMDGEFGVSAAWT